MKIFLHRTNISSSNLKNYFHTPFLIKYPNSSFQSLGNKNFNSFELPKIFINYIGLAQFQLAYKNFEFFVERSHDRHCIVQHTYLTYLSRHVNQYHLLVRRQRWIEIGRGKGEGEGASFDEDSPIKDNKRQPRGDTPSTNRLILTSWRTWGATTLRPLPSWIMAASHSRGNWRSSSSPEGRIQGPRQFLFEFKYRAVSLDSLYLYNANLNTELIGK